MHSKRSGKNKGFTLVEVVVAMSVAAILFASMITVVAPVYRIYARTRERTDAQLVAGTVLDSIRATCSNARSLEAADYGRRLVVGESGAFTVADGYLMFDGDTTDTTDPDRVLAAGVYNGKTVSLACVQGADSYTVTVTVTVAGDDGALCSLNSTIRSMRAVLD